MIFDMSAMPLFERYKIARETEAVATKQLLAAMESGNRNMPTLEDLTQRMTDAHNKAMDIWDELQQFKLGD